jgi:hypothetical protein
LELFKFYNFYENSNLPREPTEKPMSKVRGRGGIEKT